MAVAAQFVIKKVAEILQDADGVRWTAASLVEWINAGQREIQLYRPDVFNRYVTVTCVAGARQSLPADGDKLFPDGMHNDTASAQSAVRLCSRKKMDAIAPNWRAAAPRAAIQHVMYDPREPKVYWVYPPASTANKLAINYSGNPVDVPAPSGDDPSTVAGELGLDDVFANALIDYCLYRAFMKDSDYAGDSSRSQLHYQAFASAVGGEIKATQSAASPAVIPGAATAPADEAA